LEEAFDGLRKKSRLGEFWKRFRKNKLAVVGLVIIMLLFLAAIFADLICDYDLQAIGQNPAVRLQSPSVGHWFGTDAFGRDVFARIVFGARVSLTIGFCAAIISAVVGGLLGMVSAFYGGKVDNIIMRILDIFMAVPGMLLLLAIVAALGTGLANTLLAISVISVPGFARIVRSVVISVSGQEFLKAAKVCGAGDFRIILRHVLPNVLGPVIINFSMSIAGLILAGAGLSFLGMGVQPPQPEWGSMLSESISYLSSAPHLVLFPGLALLICSFSMNLIGDGMRDALDPKLKK
jgi:peptide/nickel transport system permease protein